MKKTIIICDKCSKEDAYGISCSLLLGYVRSPAGCGNDPDVEHFDLCRACVSPALQAFANDSRSPYAAFATFFPNHDRVTRDRLLNKYSI